MAINAPAAREPYCVSYLPTNDDSRVGTVCREPSWETSVGRRYSFQEVTNAQMATA